MNFYIVGINMALTKYYKYTKATKKKILSFDTLTSI